MLSAETAIGVDSGAGGGDDEPRSPSAPRRRRTTGSGRRGWGGSNATTGTRSATASRPPSRTPPRRPPRRRSDGDPVLHAQRSHGHRRWRGSGPRRQLIGAVATRLDGERDDAVVGRRADLGRHLHIDRRDRVARRRDARSPGHDRRRRHGARAGRLARAPEHRRRRRAAHRPGRSDDLVAREPGMRTRRSSCSCTDRSTARPGCSSSAAGSTTAFRVTALRPARLRAIGRRIPGRSAIEQQVDDLVAACSTVAGAPCVFGHSYGGNVALGDRGAPPGARRRRRRVRDAAVVARLVARLRPQVPSPIATRGDPADAAERFMRRLVGDARWEKLPPSTREARRSEGPAMVGELVDLREHAPWSAERIAVPVVAMCGERGAAHHRAGTEYLARAARTATWSNRGGPPFRSEHTCRCGRRCNRRARVTSRLRRRCSCG